MRGYITYFKTLIIVGFQYKTAAIAGLTTQFFWGFISAFIYTSFYSHATIDSISLKELISYVWLGQAFFALTFLQSKNIEITEAIKNGGVAYELCRPYDLYIWWYIKIISKKYASVILRCAPIIILSLLLPKPYNLGLPPTILSFILFLVTLFLGSFIVTGINLIVEILTFYTMEQKGVASIIYTVGNLFGGLLLPVPLLPDVIKKISEFLPFRLVGDLPFRVYSGNIGYSYAFQNIAFQLIWILLLIIIGESLMRHALKRVCVQGG